MSDEKSDETAESLGSRIKRMMKERGFNQTSLATKTGLERTELNRLVNGKRQPRHEEVAWLAEALGTTVEALLKGLDLPDPIRRTIRAVEEAARRTLAAESARDEAVEQLAAARMTYANEQKRWAAERAELLNTMKQVREDGRARAEDLEHRVQESTATLERSALGWADERAGLLLKLQQTTTSERSLRKNVDELQRLLTKQQGEKTAAGIFAGMLGLVGGTLLASAGED